MSEKEAGSEPLASELQEKFCHLYLVDLNGTKAAKDAGASPRSAHVIASRWLKNDKVKSRLAYLTANALTDPSTPVAERAAVMDAVDEKAADIVRHLEYMAKSDVGKLADLLQIPGLAELPDDIRLAIHSVEITEAVKRDMDGEPYTERTFKFRLHDKLGSVKLWLQKYALIAPAQTAAKKPGDALPEGDIEITMDIPKASG